MGTMGICSWPSGPVTVWMGFAQDMLMVSKPSMAHARAHVRAAEASVGAAGTGAGDSAEVECRWRHRLGMGYVVVVVEGSVTFRQLPETRADKEGPRRNGKHQHRPDEKAARALRAVARTLARAHQAILPVLLCDGPECGS